MPRFTIDEAPLAVGSGTRGSLAEEVFGLYRQLAKQEDERDARVRDATQKASAEQDALRRRLARVAGDVFLLRRCVGSIAPALRAAGLEREADRLETLGRRFDQTLAQQGVTVVGLDGAKLEDVDETVEVEGAVPAGVDVPRVHQTLEPQVSVDGKIVLAARVISAVPERAESDDPEQS